MGARFERCSVAEAMAPTTRGKVRAWNRGGGPTDWSPDGKFVVYQTQEVNAPNDLWVLPMQDNTEPFPLVASEFDDTEGVLSPDGRWLAYRSTASGQAEIYLQRLDGWRRVGGPLRVSSGVGEQPRWRRDGTELFYLSATTLMATPISRDANRPAGPSRALFAIARGSGTPGRNDYAVSPDGQRCCRSRAAADSCFRRRHHALGQRVGAAIGASRHVYSRDPIVSLQLNVILNWR